MIHLLSITTTDGKTYDGQLQTVVLRRGFHHPNGDPDFREIRIDGDQIVSMEFSVHAMPNVTIDTGRTHPVVDAINLQMRDGMVIS